MGLKVRYRAGLMMRKETLISQSVLSNLPPSTKIPPTEIQQEFLSRHRLIPSNSIVIRNYFRKMKRASLLLRNKKN